MTYTTLSNWQHELTSKGLSHNDVVRLLQDAQEQIDALRAALKPFADVTKHTSGAMYQQGGYVAGLNTVEHYHEARRVLEEVKE